MESRRSGRDDVEIYESFEAADWVANIVTFANKIQQETDVGFAEVCLVSAGYTPSQEVKSLTTPWALLHCKSMQKLYFGTLPFFNVNH